MNLASSFSNASNSIIALSVYYYKKLSRNTTHALQNKDLYVLWKRDPLTYHLFWSDNTNNIEFQMKIELITFNMDGIYIDS